MTSSVGVVGSLRILVVCETGPSFYATSTAFHVLHLWINRFFLCLGYGVHREREFASPVPVGQMWSTPGIRQQLERTRTQLQLISQRNYIHQIDFCMQIYLELNMSSPGPIPRACRNCSVAKAKCIWISTSKCERLVLPQFRSQFIPMRYWRSIGATDWKRTAMHR